MILTSKDGGATWETKHNNPDGEVLLNISFVDEHVGHAAGTGGILLSTEDGGKTWKKHIAPGSVRAFSFADATYGIAVIGGGNDNSRGTGADQAVHTHGTVVITRDGGEHWEDIAFIDSPELLPFSQTLAVATLDGTHFLMLQKEPGAEEIFVVTKDGGKAWEVVDPQNDSTNHALPSMVFAHQGEYWAFGYELVHREKGGGYGVPLTLHSKDGETWTHGVAGPKEFDSCNSQGCYMWDGAVESLYGDHEVFWATPQDGSLSKKWAIADGSACTISGSVLKCGRAAITEKPLDKPEGPGGIISINPSNQRLQDDCIDCNVEALPPDDRTVPPSMKPVHASITVRRNGTVSKVSVDYSPSRLTDEISGQLSQWLFEPAHKGSDTVESKKDVSLLLLCSGFPGRTETNRCTLHRSDEFSRSRTPTKIATPR